MALALRESYGGSGDTPVIRDAAIAAVFRAFANRGEFVRASDALTELEGKSLTVRKGFLKKEFGSLTVFGLAQGAKAAVVDGRFAFLKKIIITSLVSGNLPVAQPDRSLEEFETWEVKFQRIANPVHGSLSHFVHF